MSGPTRKKLGPVKKRLFEQIQDAHKIYEQVIDKDNVTVLLKEGRTLCAKLSKNLCTFKELEAELASIAAENEAEAAKLLNEAEEFAEIELNSNDALAALEGFQHEIETFVNKNEVMEEKQQKLALQEKFEKLRLENLLQIEKAAQGARLEMEKTAMEKKLDNDGAHKTCVKLPKLDLIKFDGNILHWQEFSDSFNSAIHQNKSLHPVDKLNYSRAQLVGDAYEAIAGLSMTNANYDIAIEILEQRFGNKQIIINSHYRELMNLQAANVETSSLRHTVNTIEKHLRSLEVLGENIENGKNIALIQSKLPREVNIKLHDDKRLDIPSSVEMLRKQLNQMISNREMVDLQAGQKNYGFKSSHNIVFH